MDFKLTSKYKPTGDQPEAIRELTEGIKRGDKSQVWKDIHNGKCYCECK